MKAILLAAGPGRRLRPLTHTGPKHLIHIAGKPILQYGIEALKQAGFKEVAIVVGYMKEKVTEYVGDGSRFGIKVTYISQEPQRGIADAIIHTRSYVGKEPFVVYLGDNLLRDGIQPHVSSFDENRSEASILLSRVKSPERFGVAEVDGQRVVRLEEKPRVPKSDLALVGVYFLTPRIFDVIAGLKPSWRGELEITDALQTLVSTGRRVDFDIVGGWWADSGRPEDLIEAAALVLDGIDTSIKGKVHESVRVNGRVSIEEGTGIEKGCRLRGPIYIGRNCTIGPETYIGPHTSIEEGCTIRGGEIENTVVLGGCRIELSREKRIVDSLIGSSSTIIAEENLKPRGARLVVGENSYLAI